MEIKKISTQTFLVYSTETTLAHVNAVAIREVDALYGTAKEAGLQTIHLAPPLKVSELGL